MRECLSCRRCFDDGAIVCDHDGSPLEPTLEGSPTIADRYSLTARLGKGGMGLVYRARHDRGGMSLGRDFALKLIKSEGPPSSTFRELFGAEARALARLRHPHIVQVTDSGIDERGFGLPYLVTELLDGEPLDVYCRQRGPQGIEAVLPVLRGVASAIDYVHREGMVHRDVKAANVFLARVEGSPDPVPKLLDFGLACAPHIDRRRTLPPDATPSPGLHDLETLTNLATGISRTQGGPLPARHSPGAGTPHYMAPEIVEGRGPTAASDIYSFGVLAYLLLAGRPPFDGALHDVLEQHRSEPPPAVSRWNPALPNGTDEVLRAALEKEPTLRPAKAMELVDGLANVAARARLTAWRRNEAPRRLATAFALSALVVAAFSYLRQGAVLNHLEGLTMDARFAAMPKRPPDPRIALVILDEVSADRPLQQMSGPLLDAVDLLFGARARAVALNFALPSEWARTRWTRMILDHQARLTLGASAAEDGRGGLVVHGTEIVDPLARSELGADWRKLFGLYNLQVDGAGIVRRGRLSYPAEGTARQSSFVGRAVETLGENADRCEPAEGYEEEFWLDYSFDSALFPTVSLAQLGESLRGGAVQFSDRLVLIGDDLKGMGNGPYPVPGGGSVPGVVVQALAVSTLLADCPVRSIDRAASVVLAALALPVFAGVLLGRRLGPWLALFGALLAAYLVMAVLALRQFSILVPMVGPVLLAVLGLVVAVILRRLWPQVPDPRATR